MPRGQRLTKHRRELVEEWAWLARQMARYFVQRRERWQRELFIPDLEAEGYLAICKAARTYDKKRLPYPKRYFVRAALNSMFRWIKKETRAPGEWKVSLEEAEDLLPMFEHPDYLSLAIEDLDECDQEIAEDRFKEGCTLRTIADRHSISTRLASLRSREIAKRLAEALGTQLPPPDEAMPTRRSGSTCRPRRSSASRSSSSRKS